MSHEITPFGQTKRTANNKHLDSQVIEGTVLTGDGVYLNSNTGTWSKANLLTPTPTGIYAGSNIVVTAGVVTLSGLEVGRIYYMDERRVESSTEIDSDDMSSLTGWSTTDSGTGAASTQTTFETRQVFKLDSGSAVAGNKAGRSQDLGTLGSKYSVTIITYLEAIGTIAEVNDLMVRADTADTRLEIHFASDGLFINDGVANNVIGSNLTKLGTFQTWTFEVDNTVSASATCDVYLEGIKVANNVDCSNTGTFTEGNFLFEQRGDTTANRISYIDNLKAGSALIIVSDNKTKIPGQIKLGYAMSTTDFIVDIEDNRIKPGGYRSGYVFASEAPTANSTFDKLTFSTESIALGTSTFPQNISGTGGSCSSDEAGFVMGGLDVNDRHSRISKLLFSNDSTSNLSAVLEENVNTNSGFQSPLAGYSLGGGLTPTVRSSTIGKLVFAGESYGNITSTLAEVKFYMSTGENQTSGFILGGQGTTTTVYSNIEKTQFSNDTNTNLVSKSSTILESGTGISSKDNFFSMGGSSTSSGSTRLSTIEKLRFSSEVNSVLTSFLSDDVWGLNNGSQTSNEGYSFGGETNTPSVVKYSHLDKLTFSTDNTILTAITGTRDYYFSTAVTD